MITQVNLSRVLEAMLVASGDPLTVEQMRRAVIDVGGERESDENSLRARIRSSLDELNKAALSRPLELKETAAGFRYVTRPEFAPYISSLRGQQPPNYSRATLETLAVIAWRQPVTRGDIEQIRGVRLNSSILRSLADRDWIRVTGARETPGRPMLYGTTRIFLDYFGLKSLEELPKSEELVTEKMQEGLLARKIGSEPTTQA